MTYNRIFALLDLHKRTVRQDLTNLANAVALAYHEPNRIKEISKPKPSFNMDDLPAMLRIPKKKELNG